MARIRSVHPGLFTDEVFACLSSDAQIFLIGLWTEADDQGVFEWKPVTLRMRIRPTKDGAVDDLLSELETANTIKSFEYEGRKYGAIRNFRRFQRPKKPNAIYLLPDQFRTYVGLTAASSELEEVKDHPSSEIPPQMEEEDGGGRGRKKERKDSTADAVPKKYFFEAGIIRLNEKDFRKWAESFTHLELKAELLSLQAWADGQGSNWFHAVAGALAKRNRQIANERRNGSSSKRLEGIV